MTTMTFETRECGRCGGVGRYCGGICFKCGGKRTQLTAAGKAASKAWTEIKRAQLLVSPADVQVGDYISTPTFLVSADGAMLTLKGYRKVLAVAPDEHNGPDARCITIGFTGHNYGGWLNVDTEAKTLTFQAFKPRIDAPTTGDLFKAPSAELMISFAAGRKGVTLVEKVAA